MTERIGIFGGTFDPPHLGHLILASEARAQLNLSRLLWVLTSIPPHKLDQTITPLEDRLAMLKLAIADEPAFEVSRLDMDRPGPYYTVDTLNLLRARRFPPRRWFSFSAATRSTTSPPGIIPSIWSPPPMRSASCGARAMPSTSQAWNAASPA